MLFRSVFVAVHGLSLVAVSGDYSSLQCAGFSLQWLLLLRSMVSRRVGFSSCGSRALERRLSSCGARAYLLRGMWDLPRPGLESVSPALAGGFLTTAPPGKSPVFSFYCCHCTRSFLIEIKACLSPHNSSAGVLVLCIECAPSSSPGQPSHIEVSSQVPPLNFWLCYSM